VVSRVDVTDDPDPVAKAGASSSTGEAASQPAIFNSAEDVVEDPTMSFQLPFCKFQKIYESIDQYPQVSEAASRALRAASGVEWTVQEKVHGSNFAIYFDPKKGTHSAEHHSPGGQHQDASDAGAGPQPPESTLVRYAKRTGFLDFERDWFYNFQQLDDRLRLGVRRVHAELLKQLPRPSRAGSSSRGGAGVDEEEDEQSAYYSLHLIVYGELYAGFYPESSSGCAHDWDSVVSERIDGNGRCKVSLDQRAVQEGIYYSPILEFMAFDVAYCWAFDGVGVGADDGAPRSTPAAGASRLQQEPRLKFLTSREFEALGGTLEAKHGGSFLGGRPGGGGPVDRFHFARTLIRTKNYGEVLSFDLDFTTTMAEHASAGVADIGDLAAGAAGAGGPGDRRAGKKSAGAAKKSSSSSSSSKKDAHSRGGKSISSSTSSSAATSVIPNVAEGIVIRSDVVLNQADLDSGKAFVPVRALVKRKNWRFAEVQDVETSVSQKEAGSSYSFAFATMVNANRLNGVLSKTVGRLVGGGGPDDNRAEVVEELEEDVWEDFYARPAGFRFNEAEHEAAARGLVRRLCEECVDLAVGDDAAGIVVPPHE